MANILLIGDGGAPTGFERVTRAIGTALHEAGHRVVHRALGYDPRKPLAVEYPYTLRAAWGTPDDPMAVTKVPRWLKEDQPDAVVMVQDIWNQVNYLAYMPESLPVLGYFPVDAPNLKWQYGLAFGRLNRAVPYTRFGAFEASLAARSAADMVATVNAESTDVPIPACYLRQDEMELPIFPALLGARQNPSAYTPIPHGLDRTVFKPVDKAAARRAFGWPEDAFIVLNVNTNQFRKRLDLTVRGFAELARWNPKALLVLHCSGGDAGGWDLLELAQLYGVADKMVCVHHTKRHLTNEELNLLFNTADVQVNTGGGEGWGLNSFEGALCGVPQMVPDWSATRELWYGHGVLLPVKDYRIPEKWATTAHASLDAETFGRLLVQLSRDPDLLKEMGVRAKELADAQPSWQDVGAMFVKEVESMLVEPPAPATTIADMLAMREGVLESELKTMFRR